ncbi:MAG: hypothetical protein JWO11_1106 [Nocardioides sp.]|nr:hypothetical protein [Nocardioides sp.]
MAADTEKHTAGAFDVRNIIGTLLGLYGVILTAMGLFADTAPERTGNINANLWAGLALLVVSAVFLVWARLRPLVVSGHAPQDPGPARRDRP